MVLLFPLTIFLVACVAMIVILYKTKMPDAHDTVEAYCDAVLKGNNRVQQDLLYSTSDILDISHELTPLVEKHAEVGKKYNLKTIDVLENLDTTIELIVLDDPSLENTIRFTAQHFSNQWLITKIKLSSKT